MIEYKKKEWFTDPEKFEAFDRIYKICAEYLDELNKGLHEDNDFNHYIFEEAISALWGTEIWKQISKQQDEN